MSLCPAGPFWTHRILTDFDKVQCFDIRKLAFSYQFNLIYCDFLFFSNIVYTSNLLHSSPSIFMKITESKQV